MGCDSSPYRTPTANLPHNSYRTPTAAYRRPALLRLHSEAPAKVRPRTHPPAQNRPRQLEGASAANKSQDSRLEGRRGRDREAQTLTGHLIGTPTGVGDRVP